MSPGYQASAGVSWRSLTVADRHAVHELVTAAEAFADGVAESTEEDLESSWDRPDLDLARMSLGGFIDGRLAAYAVVFLGRVEASVHPEWRGLGLGAHLAKWTWEVARSEGRERVGQTVSDNETSAAALFQALGYERGHTAWILRRDLDAPLPAPALPAGYRFRAYVPGADGPAIYELIDETFSEWRNADSESMGFENWAAYALRGVPEEFVVLLEYDPAAGATPAAASVPAASAAASPGAASSASRWATTTRRRTRAGSSRSRCVANTAGAAWAGRCSLRASAVSRRREGASPASPPTRAPVRWASTSTRAWRSCAATRGGSRRGSRIRGLRGTPASGARRRRPGPPAQRRSSR